MNRKSIAIVAALISALLVPLTPATAATESITPTSEITFDIPLAQKMRFDALGRAWIWNTVSNSGYPSKPRLAIFAKDASTWTRIQTVKAKKVTVNTLRFAPDGSAYATNFRKNEIVLWKVNNAGTVRKARRVALRGRAVPLDAFPNSDGSLFVLYRNRIDEFALPLRRKELPVRTIKAEFPDYSMLVALADRTIFVMQGDSNGAPLQVYGPNQSGVSEPTRTILIDSALDSSPTALDIALTPNGKVAVAYVSSGVALFEANASGGSVMPTTWYPQAPPLNSQGVDFGPNGVMGLVDFMGTTSVKVYFEPPPCAPRPDARC
jgi:hypothetical protein